MLLGQKGGGHGGWGKGGCQPEPLSVGSDQDILEGESLIGSGRREEPVTSSLLAMKDL